MRRDPSRDLPLFRSDHIDQRGDGHCQIRIAGHQNGVSVSDYVRVAVGTRRCHRQVEVPCLVVNVHIEPDLRR